MLVANLYIGFTVNGTAARTAAFMCCIDGCLWCHRTAELATKHRSPPPKHIAEKIAAVRILQSYSGCMTPRVHGREQIAAGGRTHEQHPLMQHSTKSEAPATSSVAVNITQTVGFTSIPDLPHTSRTCRPFANTLPHRMPLPHVNILKTACMPLQLSISYTKPHQCSCLCSFRFNT